MKKSVPPGVLPVASIDPSSRTPLYRQLYEGYRDAIVERRLRAGQRLPSTRTISAELRISRIPVLNAFEQLLAEGYFESRVGSGTFVARTLPEELTRAALRAADGNPMGRPGRRIIARIPAALARPVDQPWFRGRGAFGVGQPPVDLFRSGCGRGSRRATRVGPIRSSSTTATPWAFRPCARVSRNISAARAACGATPNKS